MWTQAEITLAARSRGVHLITSEVLEAVPAVRNVSSGLLHVFCAHTSASLTLTENASPAVRRDIERWLSSAVAEQTPWEHALEGPDDMPAHVKASLMGPSLSIPVSGGAPALGTWQGICLCEHRDRAGPRRLVVTLHGEERLSQHS